MKNPISTSNMFVTPDSMTDLVERIEQFNGAERALAYQVAMMAFNLCHKLVQKELDTETV